MSTQNKNVFGLTLDLGKTSLRKAITITDKTGNILVDTTTIGETITGALVELTNMGSTAIAVGARDAYTQMRRDQIAEGRQQQKDLNLSEEDEAMILAEITGNRYGR